MLGLLLIVMKKQLIYCHLIAITQPLSRLAILMVVMLGVQIEEDFQLGLFQQQRVHVSKSLHGMVCFNHPVFCSMQYIHPHHQATHQAQRVIQKIAQFQR